jgi:hypothetical protein
MSCNAGFRVVMFVLDGITATVGSAFVASSRNTELGTSAAVQNWTATPGPVSVKKGDRIVWEVRFVDTGGTMAAAGNLTYSTGGAAGVNGDSFIQFTETFGWDTSTPAGTQLFLTDTAATDLSADDDRTLSTSRGAGSTTASVSVSAGPISSVQLQRSGTNVRWYSDALTGLTLHGPALLNLRQVDSTSSNRGAIGAKLFVRDAGGTETDLAFGLVHEDGINITDAAAPALILGFDDVVLSDGWRLGLIIYADDGYQANILASTPSASYAGASANAAGDAWVQLTDSVSVFTGSSDAPFPYVGGGYYG